MKTSTKPEEFDLSRWAVCELKKLESARLHTFTQHIIGTLVASRFLLGRCLLAIDANAVYAEHGYSSSIHYAVCNGISEREAVDARRTAAYLEQLPKLTKAAERGEICWSALKAVAAKATPDTEQEWLELAQRTTAGMVQKIAGRSGRGALPGEALAEGEEQPKQVSLQFSVCPEVAVLFQHTVRDLSQAMGQLVSANQALELLVVHFHTGAEHADEGAIKKLLAGAREDLKAQAEADAREESEAIEQLHDSEDDSNRSDGAGVAGESVAILPTWGKREHGHSLARDGDGSSYEPDSKLSAWSKTVFKLLANPGDESLKLVSRVRFNAKARGLTPAQRQQILRRDGYCCSTPGCRRHLWLDVHHLVFYCRQGPTVPSNLVVVCQRYVTPQEHSSGLSEGERSSRRPTELEQQPWPASRTV